jgi:hypothetical protein
MAFTPIPGNSTLDISTATVRITIIRTRESTSTQFYPNPDAVHIHLRENYDLTGKRHNALTRSEDGLTFTTVTHWLNRQSWLDANFNDPIPLQNVIDHEEYCENNNIGLTRIREEKINGVWTVLEPGRVGEEQKQWKLNRLAELTSSTAATIWTTEELLNLPLQVKTE